MCSNVIWAAPSEKVSSIMRKMHRFRFIPRMTKFHPGICSALIHSIVSNDSVSGLRRPWSDCADAQADLGLRCLHMLNDTFSDGVVQIMYLWTEIIVRIYPFRSSFFSLSARSNLGSLTIEKSAHLKLWSECADEQADRNLFWKQMSEGTFFHATARIFFFLKTTGVTIYLKNVIYWLRWFARSVKYSANEYN